jgi:hypothetical protein
MARARGASRGDERAAPREEGAERTPPDLSNLSRDAFGEGNAETDVDFEDVFIATSDYRLAASTSRTLVLGQRGTGKSAIFLHMRDQPTSTSGLEVLTVPLAADSESWGELERVAKASNNDTTALTRQWKLTLLLLTFNKLVESKGGGAKRKRLVKQLDAEVNKVLDRTELNLTSKGMLADVFEAAARMLRQLPFTFKVQAPFVPVSLETKDTQAPDQTSTRQGERAQIILVDGMLGVVASLLDAPLSVQLLADQLDDQWQGNRQRKALLAALIEAVMDIREFLRARKLDRSMRCVIFLRSDIYQVLRDDGLLPDASKYALSELHLSWDREGLTRMIDRRIEQARVPGITKLDDIFGRRRLEGVRLVEYFFSRLVPRPRDMIQFIVYCIDKAHARGEQVVSPESLLAAEGLYSSWRKGVILEEASYGTLAAPEAVLEALVSWPRVLAPQELTRRLSVAIKDFGISESKPTIKNSLLALGVLGVQREGREPQFIWDVPPGESPDVGLSGTDAQGSYVFHPSLWRRLDLHAPPQQTESGTPTANTEE